MLISVIIPVYNIQEYIDECLNSLISQTYDGDVECLIIDDCSSDSTVSVVSDFISSYDGNIVFHLLQQALNLGPSAARNLGMQHAKGDWFFFIDGDDWITPDCFETIMKTLRKYPKCDIVVSSAESNNEWVAGETLIGRNDIPDYTEDRLWIMNALLSRPVIIPLAPWNKLYSRKFIQENKLSFLEGYIREDEIWSFDYSKYVNRVAFNKHVTYYYRVNPKGIVHSSGNYKSAEYNLKLIDYYLENLTKEGLDIQLHLISQMLLRAYIHLHNDSTSLSKCKFMFKRLFSVSDWRKQLGCLIFIYVSHSLVCKRPIFNPAKKYLFGCMNL